MKDRRICIDEILSERIQKAIVKEDKNELEKLLKKAMDPEFLNNRYIRLAGYQFDVTGTIYADADGHCLGKKRKCCCRITIM